MYYVFYLKSYEILYDLIIFSYNKSKPKPWMQHILAGSKHKTNIIWQLFVLYDCTNLKIKYLSIEEIAKYKYGFF